MKAAGPAPVAPQPTTPPAAVSLTKVIRRAETKGGSYGRETSSASSASIRASGTSGVPDEADIAAWPS
jgi:hypothetical protein